MYTICNNKCHDECVYNLIKRQDFGTSKPPMHVSRYACMVRKQAQCHKKGCNRTMGPAVVPLCPPEKYLRKHSRAPITIRPPAVPQVQLVPIPVQTHDDVKDVKIEVKTTQEERPLGVNDQCQDDDAQDSDKNSCSNGSKSINNSCNATSNAAQAGSNCQSKSEYDPKFPSVDVHSELVHPCPMPRNDGSGDACPPTSCCKRRIPRLCCNCEKPAVPTVCCSRFCIISRGCKDYIKDNAIKNIRQPAKIPIARYVDQPKGTAHDWCPSGYPRRYVYRQDYGMVPGYLVERKNQLQSKFQQEKYASEQGMRDAREKCRHLDEYERQALICGLKTNWEQVYNDFQALPLNIDTAMKVRQKTEYEQAMKDIEKDIQLLERHNHIFLADANKSFYMA